MLSVNVIRYRLRVSKGSDLPAFPEWLTAAIEARYETDSAFARAAGVSPSAVSRWTKGELRPTPKILERIAPALGVSAQTLSAIAYPELGSDIPEASYQPPKLAHPLALDVERLLAEESPVPSDERATLANLIEHVVKPYRRYLRKRRAG